VLRLASLPLLRFWRGTNAASTTSGVCGTRQPVDMWTTQERCPHTHSATINNKHQFDCFRRLGSDPARHLQATSGRAAMSRHQYAPPL
jgi:hypothetical protein